MRPIHRRSPLTLRGAIAASAPEDDDRGTDRRRAAM